MLAPSRPLARHTSVVAAAAVLIGVGCSGQNELDEGSSEPIGETALPEILGPECQQHGAGHGFSNGFFPQKYGSFAARFYLEPSQEPMDGVVGLSNGRADAFTDLAAIVRINEAGYFDVRNGGAYMADTQVPYDPGKRVRVDMRVDIPNRVYDVFVDPVWEYDPDAPSILIAKGYSFRTEQGSVSRLDNVGRIVDSASGSFQLCHFSSFGPCSSPTPGGRWLSQPFPTQTGTFRVTFEVNTGDWEPLDLVIGLAGDVPTRFSSLAAILRFNPAGFLDVRDAGTYRYDTQVSFSRWQVFRAMMTVDVKTRTYSVSVTKYDRGTPTTYALATSYRFRSEQAYATSLSHFGTIVDSAAGNPNVCSFLVDYP